MRRVVPWLFASAALAAGCWWWYERHSAVSRVRDRIRERAEFYVRFGMEGDGRREFAPLPSFVPHDPGRARLGGLLFNDGRLGSGSKRSCGNCHWLNRGGSDGRRHGKVLTRPAMNSAFAEVFLHDGSVTGLTALVSRMMADPRFGAQAPAEALRRLDRDRRLKTLFERQYPDGLAVSNAVDALAHYCRTLFTERGGFDLYLGGNTNALPPAARSGFAAFRARGCAGCHSGPALGTLAVSDGIKVPALRGLAFRSSYFSTGEIADLAAAVQAMPGGDAEGAERAALLEFLRGL